MNRIFKAAALIAATAALAPAPVAAQEQGATQERVSRLVVYGKDPCPRGTGEIVVCARRPESERYRIPKNLRNTDDNDPESTSWAVRAESLEYVGRTGIQSCSTVGPAGFTGCWQQMMQAARNERRAGTPR